MASSLSRVPPVWPSPRPEIIGTAPPQAATIGASSSETLSPTPPVECLSSTGRSRSQRSTSPERVIALVRAHAVDDDRHRQGSDLGIADRAVGDAGDEPLDLLGAQRGAVAHERVA